MEIKCEYCGSFIEDSLEKCPNCGATNENIKRMVNSTPKTIEELKAWYTARNLPPYETTRFFIGINYTKPRAFGIYEENGEFIVYKNKATGERAIRYRGIDEAYAVNELFLKLKSEILNQKSHQTGRKGKKNEGVFKSLVSWFFFIGMFIAISIFSVAYSGFLTALVSAAIAATVVSVIYGIAAKKIKPIGDFKKKINKKFKQSWIISLASWFFIAVLVFIPVYKNCSPSYYRYNDTIYCHYDGDWYGYDSSYDDYYYVYEEYLPVEIYNNPADYEYDYSGYEWDSEGFTKFQDSDYYEEYVAPDYSSSDSSYDWDSSDSWDSDSTDWGSDW